MNQYSGTNIKNPGDFRKRPGVQTIQSEEKSITDAKVRKIPDISQQPGLKITNLKLITNEKHFAGAKISKSPESCNSGDYCV